MKFTVAVFSLLAALAIALPITTYGEWRFLALNK